MLRKPVETRHDCMRQRVGKAGGDLTPTCKISVSVWVQAKERVA